jgi:hypothetical protein
VSCRDCDPGGGEPATGICVVQLLKCLFFSFEMLFSPHLSLRSPQATSGVSSEIGWGRVLCMVPEFGDSKLRLCSACAHLPHLRLSLLQHLLHLIQHSREPHPALLRVLAESIYAPTLQFRPDTFENLDHPVRQRFTITCSRRIPRAAGGWRGYMGALREEGLSCG